jgi:hypothetical protein
MSSPIEDIDDPEGYNRRRRLRAVHDARERILEQRRSALDLKAIGRIGERTYRDILRESVESFVLEIEQVLRRYEADAEPNLNEDSDARAPSWYLDDAPLGQVRLPPDGQRYSFEGLLSVLEAPDPIICEWQDTPDPPAGFKSHPLASTDTRRKEVQIPERVLLDAVRVGMRFLSDAGLDIDIDGDDREGEATYEHLLQAQESQE